MFEKYSPSARRAVFSARQEAAQAGSVVIEAEHLLLGVLTAGEDLVARLKALGVNLESIRRSAAERHPGRAKVATVGDMPLSQDARRAVLLAFEEAEQAKQKEIAVEHLLMGLLRVEESFAAGLLRTAGVTLQKLREEASRPVVAPPPPEEPETDGPARERNLTALARRGALNPLVGRERELERAVQILSRRTRHNLVLVGASGVGKTALVEGLAQRIADGDVPQALADCEVLSVDATALDVAAKRMREGIQSDRPSILCVEGLFDLAAGGAGWNALETLQFVEPLLSRGMRCIATGSPLGFRQTREKAPALARHFEPLLVAAPNEEETRQILRGLKEQYERFHGIAIGDDSIDAAIRISGVFLANRQLPDRAIDLIDEAGARVKLRIQGEPRNIAELKRRIRRNTRDLETAMAKHDFDKARQLGDADRADRESLMRLLEERKAAGTPGNALTASDIEEVVSDRTGAPAAAVQAALKQAGAGDYERLAAELAARTPVERREGVPFLAGWLANCSPDDAEVLASLLRSLKRG